MFLALGIDKTNIYFIIFEVSIIFETSKTTIRRNHE